MVLALFGEWFTLPGRGRKGFPGQGHNFLPRPYGGAGVDGMIVGAREKICHHLKDTIALNRDRG